MIGQYLPTDEHLLYMMKRSYEILKDHPLNVERKKKGLNPANCCWFWGAGTRPSLAPFEEKYGKKGMMISAVDLLKGIAVGAKMGVAHVEGANGGLNTNYEGKTQAAIDALHDGYDFAYIHVEAPDEMGHQGSVERKVKAIEYLDQRVIGPLTQEPVSYTHLVGASGCRILVTLLYEMQRRHAKKGLATLCVGGGMGCSAIVEMDN